MKPLILILAISCFAQAQEKPITIGTADKPIELLKYCDESHAVQQCVLRAEPTQADALQKELDAVKKQLADMQKMLEAGWQKYQKCDIALTQLQVLGDPKK